MKRYCELCDRWVAAKQTVCKACGAPTSKAEARRGGVGSTDRDADTRCRDGGGPEC